jgi:hypothetical protein
MNIELVPQQEYQKHNNHRHHGRIWQNIKG